MTDDMNLYNTELLTEASEIIEGKSETHGSPENNFENIARYWNVYLDIEGKLAEPLTESDVAEMMALLKKARAQTGEYNDDDYRDRLAYTNFAANFRYE